MKSVRPIIQYKQFFPMQKGRNAIGINFQGSFLTGYGGLVAPPFQRFYMGGENDLRGFDIRSVSPIAFLPNKAVINLTNPDGTIPTISMTTTGAPQAGQDDPHVGRKVLLVRYS